MVGLVLPVDGVELGHVAGGLGGGLVLELLIDLDLIVGQLDRPAGGLNLLLGLLLELRLLPLALPQAALKLLKYNILYILFCKIKAEGEEFQLYLKKSNIF